MLWREYLRYSSWRPSREMPRFVNWALLVRDLRWLLNTIIIILLDSWLCRYIGRITVSTLHYIPYYLGSTISSHKIQSWIPKRYILLDKRNDSIIKEQTRDINICYRFTTENNCAKLPILPVAWTTPPSPPGQDELQRNLSRRNFHFYGSFPSREGEAEWLSINSL